MRLPTDLLRTMSWLACCLPALNGLAGDWRAEADARIEAHRKRDLRIRATDTSGRPIPGVDVRAKQVRSHFAFGSALAKEVLDTPDYADFFAEHFEWAVFEADTKWKLNEVDQGVVDYEIADALVSFCQENGIRMRGHNVFWAKPEHVQNWVKTLDDTALQAALQARIDSVVPRYAGAFEHWDVNNELAHGAYYGQRLGPQVRSWMFQEVRRQDADVRLFVNDYSVINRGEVDSFLNYTQRIIDGGGEVNGLGVQGHYYEPVNPEQLLERLDALAEFGLPVWITEFDYSNPDDMVRADSLEALHRVAFSHPAVEGIMLWGFWAGRHWRGEDAALVELDFSLNEAGQRYLDLREEWTTTVAGPTDDAGELALRGFHGSYELVLESGWAAPRAEALELRPDGPGAEQVLVVEFEVPTEEETWLLKSSTTLDSPRTRDVRPMFSGAGPVGLDFLGEDGLPASGDDDAHVPAVANGVEEPWAEVPGTLVVYELAHPFRELRISKTAAGLAIAY